MLKRLDDFDDHAFELALEAALGAFDAGLAHLRVGLSAPQPILVRLEPFAPRHGSRSRLHLEPGPGALRC